MPFPFPALTGLGAGPSDGVYRPPKLNPVAMPEDRALSNKEMRRIREAQRRAQRRYGPGCKGDAGLPACGAVSAECLQTYLKCACQKPWPG